MRKERWGKERWATAWDCGGAGGGRGRRREKLSSTTVRVGRLLPAERARCAGDHRRLQPGGGAQHNKACVRGGCVIAMSWWPR